MIELRFAQVQYLDFGARSYFVDGSSCDAVPHTWAHHYSVIAHRCGYGDDLLAYCREHEVCHHIVEEWLHDRASRILWSLAHDKPMTGHEAAYEEMMAQALQRFVRAGERPIIGGVDWDGMRAYALAKLGAVQ